MAKVAKTSEELAEIAYLDKLRSCEGEAMPVGLPLACVVNYIFNCKHLSEDELMALVPDKSDSSISDAMSICSDLYAR